MRMAVGRTVSRWRFRRCSLATTQSPARGEAQRTEGFPRKPQHYRRVVLRSIFALTPLLPALLSTRCAPRRASNVQSWIMPLAVEYATPEGGFALGTACAGAFPPR